MNGETNYILNKLTKNMMMLMMLMMWMIIVNMEEIMNAFLINVMTFIKEFVHIIMMEHKFQVGL